MKNAALKIVDDSNVHYSPSEVIDRRVTIKVFLSCSYSLLQGDPDDGNRQRLDANGHAFITPMGIKRWTRDELARMGHAIHVSRGADLSQAVHQAAKTLDLDTVETPDEPTPGDDKGKPKKGRKKGHALKTTDKDAIVKKMGAYMDFRLFGGVLTTLNLGEAGATQIGFGVSVDPVSLIEASVTRVAVANEKEAETKDRTMGSLSVIQYGLISFEVSISPWQARRTGMTWGDYDLLLKVFTRMWDNAKSTTRNRIVVEKIVSFIHSSELGDAQDARLCDAVQATLKNPGTAPRSTKDYTFTVDMSQVPETIKVIDVPV